MRTHLNEAIGIYGRQQSAGRQIAVVVMMQKEHAAMHEQVRKDIEKIAQAAGVEMTKTACIVVRRGMREWQEKGLKELNTLLQEIRLAKDKKDIFTKTGIATGYANAMYHYNLVSKEELKNVIDVIGQAGEKAVFRMEAARRLFWVRIVTKGARL